MSAPAAAASIVAVEKLEVEAHRLYREMIALVAKNPELQRVHAAWLAAEDRAFEARRAMRDSHPETL